jgi:uncharacterized membrane protein YbhN (UPF0104 family)
LAVGSFQLAVGSWKFVVFGLEKNSELGARNPKLRTRNPDLSPVKNKLKFVFVELTRPTTRWAKVMTRGLKALISVLAISYIVWRLRQEPAEHWKNLFQLDGRAISLLLLGLALAPLNWAFEAAKWRIMMRPYYPEISFRLAYRAVLTGISTGIFTPNGLGAFMGRVFSLKSGYRVEATVLSFVDGLAQMGITLWMGGLASFYFLLEQSEHLQEWLHLSLSQILFAKIVLLTGMGIALFLALFPQLPIKILHTVKLDKVLFHRMLEAVSQVERKGLWAVLLLAGSRYLVFSLQYILLLYAFGYEGTMAFAFAMTSTVFLLKSLVPSIALSELGIRESVALAIMGSFGVATLTAFSSTFLLYLINIMLPALIGLRFVMKKSESS